MLADEAPRRGHDGATAAGPTQALVLYPYSKAEARRDGGGRDPDARLAEAIGLAQAIELEVAHGEAVSLDRRRPATLFGTGVTERYGELVAAMEITVAVIDAALSPVQQRNLERAWKCKVIDRTALILEIFGARARTHEGRLQVELASLNFQRSRLVRSWTHLERQRGGFGFLGGPGESQLEMDRRLIGDRIVRIKKELETVVRTRGLHRDARKRVPYPVVALVGYTNAGKSTLFNRLTRSDVVAQDMLFATLDPTMRRIRLKSGQDAILSDTVGFISELPHQLVAAFRATLEEVREADLIVHVRDAAHPESEAQKQDVLKVLAELDLDDAQKHRMLEVLNKIDLLPDDAHAGLAERLGQADDGPMAISALSGEGCDVLVARIEAIVSAADQVRKFTVPVSDGAAIAWLYAHGRVLGRDDDDRHARLTVSLDPADADRFERRFAVG
jgi:GTPase